MKRLFALLVFCALAVTVAGPLFPPSGATEPAAPSIIVESHLPAGNYRAVAVDTGKEALIIGGRNGTTVSSAVVRYDYTTRQASYAPYGLPGPRMVAAAVYDGTTVFVFGGSDGPAELDTIAGMTPATGSVGLIGTRLPSPRIGMAAAWDGKNGYIFGGHSNGTFLKEIHRFDPRTLNITVMGASMPAGRAGLTAAATPQGIFLFGGNYKGAALDEVLRYDPETDTLTALPGRLPYPLYHAAAVWTGQRVLLFGGSADRNASGVSMATDGIVEFNPVTGTSHVLPAVLPSPRERTTTVYHGGRALVFGGQAGVQALDDVVVFGEKTGTAEPQPSGLDRTILAVTAALIALTICTVVYFRLNGSIRSREPTAYNLMLFAMYGLGMWLLFPLGYIWMVFYLAFAAFSNLWFMLSICPHCLNFGKTSCHSGCGPLSARMVKKRDPKRFAGVFRRNIPVVAVGWFLPIIGGVAAVYLSGGRPFALLNAATLLAVFSLLAFYELPRASKAGCLHCSMRKVCPGAKLIRTENR